jgi:hypothetical protein
VSERPAISILIPWCERDEVRLTLAANAPLFRAHDAEIVVLNCGGSSRRLHGLIEASETTGVRQLDIPQPRFNKSLALNLGLAQARAELVFVLDTDVALLSPIPVDAVDESSVVTIEWTYESVAHSVKAPPSSRDPKQPTTLQFAFRNGARVCHELSRFDEAANRRSGLGMLLARKSDLLKIEGYNSDLEGWGWEDDDVLVRLQYLLGLRRMQAGAALHLTHGDDRRNLRATRSQSDRRNFLKCCRNYNHGRFLGTYRLDLAGHLTNPAAGSLTAVEPPDRVDTPGQPLPEDCGSEGSSGWPPSLGELLLEAALLKMPLEDCAILLVGMAGSRLAEQLPRRCRQLSAVASSKAVYDLIIDSNLVRGVCCRRHLVPALANASSHLAPQGWLAVVDRAGEPDLAALANQAGLHAARVACGVQALRKV